MLEIQQTTDYDRFTLYNQNRPIDHANFKRIRASVQDNNLLHLNPIIVDKEFGIIDGQHRLKVAEDLQVPIYFVQADEATLEDAIRLNANKKDWSLQDYLDYHIQSDRAAYINLQKFMNQHELNITDAIALLGHGGASPNRERLDEFREGKFQDMTWGTAMDVVKKLEELGVYWDFVKTRSFIRAFVRLNRNDEFDFKRLLRKCEYASAKVNRQPTAKLYLREIEQLYNYKAQDIARLF